MLGIVAISVTWLLLFAVYCGLGSIFSCSLGVRLTHFGSWFFVCWLGWISSLVVLQIWHFFFPINDIIRALIVGSGLIGLYWNRADLRTALAGLSHQRWFLIVALLFTIWLANRSLRVPALYDMGLYHLHIIRWSSTYPVVPGLGNLHSRLAFNTASFLFPAFLNGSLWADRSYHLANSFLYGVLWLQLLYTILSSMRSKVTPLLICQWLFLPMIFFMFYTRSAVPGIASDAVVFLLQAVIFLQVLDLIERDAESTSEGQAWLLLISIVVLSFFGIAIKQSMAMFTLTICGFVLMVWWIKFPHISARIRGIAALFAAVTVLILLPMMARSVLMTGYAAYPLTIGEFDVEWKIPQKAAQAEYDAIRAWARIPDQPPDEVLANWNWLNTWLDGVVRTPLIRDWVYFVFPAVWVVIGGGVILLAALIPQGRSKLKEIHPYYSGLSVLLILSVVFWFFSAPDIRFLGASIWGLVALVTAALFLLLSEQYRRSALMLLCALMFLPTLQFMRGDFWVPSGTESGLHPLERQADVRVYTTDHGLEVFAPNDSDQCWDAPLPCTPYPDRNLRLRETGDLSSGFILANP